MMTFYHIQLVKRSDFMILKKDDEVIITKSEHASNVLPWIRLSEEIGIVIKYMDLASEMAIITEQKMKNSLDMFTDKTGVHFN